MKELYHKVQQIALIKNPELKSFEYKGVLITEDGSLEAYFYKWNYDEPNEHEFVYIDSEDLEKDLKTLEKQAMEAREKKEKEEEEARLERNRLIAERQREKDEQTYLALKAKLNK